MPDNGAHHMCDSARAESLRCIAEHYEDKNTACLKYFEAYKECKKRETEARRMANNGGQPTKPLSALLTEPLEKLRGLFGERGGS